MNNALITGLFFFMLAVGTVAADFPQWRGPERTGVLPGSLNLPDKPVKKPIWKSEEVLSDKDGGFASPIVVDGKVYQYCCWRTYHKFDHRILSKNSAKKLGSAPPENMPALLLEKMEAARIAEEQKKMRGGELRRWAEKWLNINLSAEQKKDKNLYRFCRDRLNKGKNAIPLDVFEKIKPILDKRFETQAEFDAWLAKSGIDQDLWHRSIKRLIPTKTSTFENIMFCFDAATGKTLWKKKYPTESKSWSSSCTPCVANGKLYFIGAKGMAYCLDATTGEEKWKTQVNPNVAGNGYNSCFLFLDGKVFILCNKLVAMDADTGKVIWEKKNIKGNDSSPVIWKSGDKSYLICGQKELFCLDPGDGKEIWKINPPNRCSTPVITGDLMAIEHGKGLVVYQLSAEKAEQLMTSDKCGSRGGSPIFDGTYVYSGSRDAGCVEAKTGKVIWTLKNFDDFSSPVFVDGKLLCFGDRKNRGKFLVLEPMTGKTQTEIKINQLRCTSPVVVGDKLFVRGKKALSCYRIGQ